MLHYKNIALLFVLINMSRLHAAASGAEETVYLGKGWYTQGKLIATKIDSRGFETKYIESGNELIKIWKDTAERERVSNASASTVIQLGDEDYILPEVFHEIISSHDPNIINTSLYRLLSAALTCDAETYRLKQVGPIDIISEEEYANLRGHDVLDGFYPERKHGLLRLWELARDRTRFTVEDEQYLCLCHIDSPYSRSVTSKVFAVKTVRAGFGCIRVLNCKGFGITFD